MKLEMDAATVPRRGDDGPPSRKTLSASIAVEGIDQPYQRSTRQEAIKIVSKECREALFHVLRLARNVRREPDGGVGVEGVAFGQGLGRGYIERGRRDLARVQP